MTFGNIYEVSMKKRPSMIPCFSTFSFDTKVHYLPPPPLQTDVLLGKHGHRKIAKHTENENYLFWTESNTLW